MNKRMATKLGITSQASRWVLGLFFFIAVCGVVGPGGSAEAQEAKPWSVGDTIEGFQLEDQFGKVGRVDESTGLILFSRDMEGGELLSTALQDKNSRFLSDRQTVYVSDINGMPGLVARLFALPKMRNRGYPMLLDRKGEVTARLPDQEGAGTLIELDELQIVRIDFLSNAEEITAHLEARSPQPVRH